MLITGAGSGLGLATAGRLAADGARVIACDINRISADAAVVALPGSGHVAYELDVSDRMAVDEVVGRAQEQAGVIDVLVNCAGISDTFVPTIEQSVESWQRLIDVNLTGTYLMSRAVAVGMLERRNGVVLNINSIAGVLGLPVRTAYSASKAGVGMLTRVLACEWGPYGVRVNAVAPGYIRTPMTNRLIAEGKIDEQLIRRRTPMGDLGEPTHIADALAFLASDRASFITGVTLPVDGGYCSFGAPSDAFDGPLN